MSNKIFLYSHTGSQNRGCEAIIRSTVALLKQITDYETVLVTSDDSYDLKLGLNNICTIKKVGVTDKNLIQHALCAIERIVFKRYQYAEYLSQKNVIKSINKGDYIFVVGGDTYCYDAAPISCYAANAMAKKKGAKTVLWACSLEKSKIDKRMLADFENYDYIVPREKETYELLTGLNLKNPKIVLASDPAFNLELKPIHENLFSNRKFIGINVSPIAYKNETARANFINCINSILESTDNSILLIPHVYVGDKIDADVLKKLYDSLPCKERIVKISEELSCEQLKYLISKCEAFIGCRTHSTIAAYSTGVPTIVIGYSVKANGIAKDLFKTSAGYVIMYDNLNSTDELSKAFFDILGKRAAIRQELNTLMPEYKSRSLNALKQILC